MRDAFGKKLIVRVKFVHVPEEVTTPYRFTSEGMR